jgi:hypothetical protein
MITSVQWRALLYHPTSGDPLFIHCALICARIVSFLLMFTLSQSKRKTQQSWLTHSLARVFKGKSACLLTHWCGTRFLIWNKYIERRRHGRPPANAWEIESGNPRDTHPQPVAYPPAWDALYSQNHWSHFIFVWFSFFYDHLLVNLFNLNFQSRSYIRFK